jgi:bifunctional UDP-N-acetylglucosamine pyrophosphorylase/glucosamine-1-phosphate N-acetyltransferase
VGPVIIGQNCDIGPNCVIRAGTAIGDHCHIGASVEVNNCIVMSGSKIPHLNFVGDSIIGENCNLGAGTKIANMKLDQRPIKMNGVETYRRTLGAVIGDNVQTGINASINAGTVIGNKAFIGPEALARGVIAAGAKIL